MLFDQLKYIFSLIYLIYFLSKLSIFRTEKKNQFLQVYSYIMIRIKPEQDVTKRKAGVFRVYHLFFI